MFNLYFIIACYFYFVNMCILEEFILNLHESLSGTKNLDNNIIRRHTMKLEQLGDVSFPLSIKNWYHLIERNKLEDITIHNIMDCCMPQREINMQIEELKERTKKWLVKIERVDVIDNDVNIFLSRSQLLFKNGIKEVLIKGEAYGSSELIQKDISLDLACDIKSENFAEIDLSILRLLILRDVTSNLVRFMTNKSQTDGKFKVIFTLNSVMKDQISILCGPVLNNDNLKDSKIKSNELLIKRAADMRMMAQHKYGIQVKPNASSIVYFEKLGKAAVTIEMLSNKPHKALKLVMNDSQSAHKGASFIFYNCARIAVLFNELQKRIEESIYPELPPLEEVDFSLLNQPEEWRLFYVYVLQFPITVKNCIRDVEKGIINPQYLISFLSSLSSVFSGYYRRIRILMDPREHLFATLYARVYLLKALQCIFHNALNLLNIEPIKEM